MDFSLSLLRKNKKHAVCGNAESIPFKDNTFDVVYSIILLEHVKDPFKVVNQCRRVLNKNCILILITPNKGMELLLDASEKLNLKIPEGPHRFLDYKELQNIATKNDMSILSSGKIILFPFSKSSSALILTIAG